MKINVNDKVLIETANALLKSYNGKVAVVKRIYPDVIPPIAYVEIEEDPTDIVAGFKVPIADLVAIPDKSDGETRTNKIESTEKTEITITPDEFSDIACQVIAEETKGCKIVGFLLAAFIAKVREALFVEPWEND